MSSLWFIRSLEYSWLSVLLFPLLLGYWLCFEAVAACGPAASVHLLVFALPSSCLGNKSDHGEEETGWLLSCDKTIRRHLYTLFSVCGNPMKWLTWEQMLRDCCQVKRFWMWLTAKWRCHLSRLTDQFGTFVPYCMTLRPTLMQVILVQQGFLAHSPSPNQPGVGVGCLFTEVALFNHSDGCWGGAPSVSHFSNDSLVLSNSYELL